MSEIVDLLDKTVALMTPSSRGYVHWRMSMPRIPPWKYVQYRVVCDLENGIMVPKNRNTNHLYERYCPSNVISGILSTAVVS